MEENIAISRKKTIGNMALALLVSRDLHAPNGIFYEIGFNSVQVCIAAI